MKQSATWEWEHTYHQQGLTYIAGLDEVGRGCWAGPMVAAAFMFAAIPTDIQLYDSKVTTEKQRHDINKQLLALGYKGVGEVSAQEIDAHGLQAAQYIAYERAIAALPIMPEVVLLDGRPWQACPWPNEAIIDGDAKVASIAAASILAKVHRDTLMRTTLHEQYPVYRFDLHVGYGTKVHQEALQAHGVSPIHRASFKPIRKFLDGR